MKHARIIQAHPTMFGVGSYWLFSAFVGGMPVPATGTSPLYVWLFNSLHILAGNLTSAAAKSYPSLGAARL